MNKKENFQTTHFDLLKLNQALGYPISDRGLCAGFAGMLLRAWILKQDKTFYERLALIATYKNDGKLDITKLVEAINQAQDKIRKEEEITENDRRLIDIRAFCEGMLLFLSPHQYQNLFNDPLITQAHWLSP